MKFQVICRVCRQVLVSGYVAPDDRTYKTDAAIKRLVKRPMPHTCGYSNGQPMLVIEERAA